MRLFRLLLWLFPASFRREFGSEMAAVFEARRRDADGPLGRGLFWLETVADMIRSAAAAHWDILRQDLRFISRSLARTPGFTATAILVTALGVGANAAAFSVTDFVLLRPLPFPEPERLVRLWEDLPGYEEMELSAGNYRDWQAGSSAFDATALYLSFDMNLTGGDAPERIAVTLTSPELFSILGSQPAVGRGFTAEDDRPGTARTAILSDRLWRSRFGSDPSVVGRSLDLDGYSYQVIGVMPPAFQFPSKHTVLWIPTRLTEADYAERADNSYLAIGRLRPGMTIDRAEADLDVIAARLERLYPVANKQTGARVVPLRDDLSERSRLLLLALSGASLCILLIACANLGNLLLARGVARQRELAVRTALGAGRERLVRQAVTESLVIALAGGVIGVATAVVTVPLLSRLVPDSFPTSGSPSVDARVLLVAGAMTLITCLLFAVLPTLRTKTSSDATELRGGSRGGGRRERVRAVLVTVEVAASVVLLVASGLLMRAIARIREVDPGFRTESVYTLRTALSEVRYGRVVERAQYYREVLAQVGALPGVRGAAFVSCLPMVCGGGIWPVEIDGQPAIREANKTASMRFVTPGYFEVMGIPVLHGRDVTERDEQAGLDVAVVSRSLTDRYWPGQNPLGKRFQFTGKVREVVGVVADTKVRGLERTSEPQIYLPAAQVADSSFKGYWPQDLVVKTAEGPATLLPALRRIIASVDADQPISNPRPLAEIVDDQTASRSVQLRILSALAAVALLLAAVGIHGLLSFMVSQRVREIGVRMALGARAGSVVGLVVGRGILLAGLGIVPGVAVGYLAGRGMRAALFGVPPADLVTFALVVGLCLVMAVIGSLVPALRAVRIDPITAIKADS